jgi:CDP-glycerol glycerophosphotransferase (TagB/SpsB family)
VAHEHQPIITQLFARARSIDVLTDVVYEYRAREDRSSISQQTATLKDLRARIAAWEISRDVLQAETSQEIYDGWLQTLFDSHFHWYLASAGTVDDEYWTLLRTVVRDLMEGAPQELWDRPPRAKPVLLTLTRLDRRADAQELVRSGSEQVDRWQNARGWLFDFELSAPGPLCDTTDEVVAHLLDGVRSRHQEQYDRFKADFLDLEDGRAGERFVDAVFLPRGDA